MEVIRNSKNGRAPGSDKIQVEILKAGGEQLYRRLHKIICKIWNNEQIPMEWKQGVVVPIYKKGDTELCKNYRGISLLKVAYKILTTLIQRQLTK